MRFFNAFFNIKLFYMYKKKNYKKKTNKKNVAKKGNYTIKRFKKSYTGIGRSIPFDDAFPQKLPYTSLFTATVSNLGTISNAVYCINGMYDPDVGGIGHQPLGFDQLCPAIYNNYIVHGCKWSMRVFNVHGDAVMCGLHVSKNGSLPHSSQEALLECERQRTKICQPVNSANAVVNMSGYIDIAKVFGVSKKEIQAGITTYQGDASNNPSTKCYLIPFFWNTNTTGSAQTTTYTCEITLTFYATFFTPIAIAQS